MPGEHSIRAFSSRQVSSQRTFIFIGRKFTALLGSGGFINDLVFYGGLKGAVFGNQQFTVRYVTFLNEI